jgi:hypothetical protein
MHRELDRLLLAHERSFMDPVFRIPIDRLDAQRSFIRLDSELLKCTFVAVGDASLRFFVAFRRPGGRYVFDVGPGASFATWEEMESEADANERRYELDGFLRSTVRVERWSTKSGELVKERYAFNRLRYSDQDQEYVTQYRLRYAPFSSLRRTVHAFEPWVDSSAAPFE